MEIKISVKYLDSELDERWEGDEYNNVEELDFTCSSIEELEKTVEDIKDILKEEKKRLGRVSDNSIEEIELLR
jgi:hypothetical protein